MSRRRKSDLAPRRGETRNKPRDVETPRESRGYCGRHLVWTALLVLVIVGALAWVITSRLDTAQTSSPPPVPELGSVEPSSALATEYGRRRNRIQADPTSDEAWGQLGLFFLANHYDVEATTCLTYAGELNRDEFRWPYFLGLNLSVTDPEAAVVELRRAAELLPRTAIVQSRLGELLLHLQRDSEAETHLQAALALEPRNLRARLTMARLHLQRDEPAVALQWMQGLADNPGADRSVWELLAQVYRRMDRREEALAALAQAEQLPDAPPIWEDPFVAEVLTARLEGQETIDQAEVLMEQGQFPAAIQSLQEALVRDPRDPQVFTTLARAYRLAGQLPQAIETLQTAQRQHPLSADISFQLGVTCFLDGRLADAAASFRETVQRKPDHALAHYNLGHTLLKLGDREAALAQFRETIRHRPAYVDAHINLARLLHQLQDDVSAAEHLRIAQQLAPENAEVHRLPEELQRSANEATK